ncbi:MAG TPA: SbcC/MukB-like Walker B domain-containing protein, partial [Candidatus Thermoplasmatota archaeon]|nr:SbcC/MukB-like Walker B domain-containing protein [Candidatus Thermoplasmatota archaeon]
RPARRCAAPSRLRPARVETLCIQAARTAQMRAQAARDAAARRASLGPTQERLVAAEEARRLALTHEEARRRHAQAAQHMQAQAQRIARLQAERDALAAAPPSEEAVALLEQAVQDLVGDVERAGQARAVARALHQELAARLEHLEHVGADAACPTCEAPLGPRLAPLRDGSRARLQEVARQLAELEPLSQAKARQVAELRREQQRLESLRAQAQRDAERAERLDRQLAMERAALAQLEAQGVPDPGPVPDLLRIEREAALARQLHDDSVRSDALASQLAVLEADERSTGAALEEAAAARQRALLALPPLDPEVLGAARQRLAAAEAGERAANLALQRAQSGLAEAEAALAACRRREEEAARARAEEARLEAEAREWGAVAGRVPGTGLLERFRDHLVGRVGPAISQEAGRLLSAFTGGRYAEVRLGEDYEVFVADGGIPYTLDRFSGGEQDLVHLALRLAVSRLLAERGGTELRFLALDEVFGSLDRSRRDLVVASLQQLGGLYAQVLVISHVEGLQEELGQALVVAEDAEGNAALTLHNG